MLFATAVGVGLFWIAGFSLAVCCADHGRSSSVPDLRSQGSEDDKTSLRRRPFEVFQEHMNCVLSNVRGLSGESIVALLSNGSGRPAYVGCFLLNLAKCIHLQLAFEKDDLKILELQNRLKEMRNRENMGLVDVFKGANDAFEEYYDYMVASLRRILRKYSLRITGNFEFPEFKNIASFSPVRLAELLKREDSFDLCEIAGTAGGSISFFTYETALVKLIKSKYEYRASDDTDSGTGSFSGQVGLCAVGDTGVHYTRSSGPKYARYSHEEFHASLQKKFLELFGDTMVSDLILPSLHAYFDLIHKMTQNFLVFVTYIKRRAKCFIFDKWSILDEDLKFVSSFKSLDLDALYVKVIECGTDDMRAITDVLALESRERGIIN